MASELQASDEAGNARVQAVLKLASVATRREHFERDLRNLEGVRQLAESGANRERLCRILYWTGRMHFVLGNFERGVEYAQQALRVAEEVGGGDNLPAEPMDLLARISCCAANPRRLLSTRRATSAKCIALAIASRKRRYRACLHLLAG